MKNGLSFFILDDEYGKQDADEDVLFLNGF